MDKNIHEHKHEWNENLECACGAKLGPPESKIKRNPISKNKPAIQIIVELRNKITKSLDEAMEEILKEENPCQK